MYKNGNKSENRRLSRDLIRLRLGVEKLEKLETRVMGVGGDFGLTHMMINWRLESMAEDYNNGCKCSVRFPLFYLSIIPAIPSIPRSLCIIQSMIPGLYCKKDPVIPSEPNQASTDHLGRLRTFQRMRSCE
jgi:hypothetical protein